jgi:hypothetical protein
LHPKLGRLIFPENTSLIRYNQFMSKPERRQHERVPVAMRIRARELSEDDLTALLPMLEQGAISLPAVTGGLGAVGMVEVEATNLSLGGIGVGGHVRVVEGEMFSPGRELAAEFELPGRQEPIRAVVEVVWKGKKGHGTLSGFSFVAVRPEDLKAIQEFVKGAT